jgi:hypothetical protein
MISVAILVAFVGAGAVAGLTLVQRPNGRGRFLRRATLALTILVVAMLAPFTIADAGAAAGYLLGVPLIAAALPVVAFETGRSVTPADMVGALALGAWGLILALGIGFAFLPSAALLAAAAVSDIARRSASASGRREGSGQST